MILILDLEDYVLVNKNTNVTNVLMSNEITSSALNVKIKYSSIWQRKILVIVGFIMITDKHRQILRNKLLEERGSVCEDCSKEEIRLFFVDGDNENFQRGNVKLLCKVCIGSKSPIEEYYPKGPVNQHYARVKDGQMFLKLPDDKFAKYTS